MALLELDSLSILTIIDNDLDPISKYTIPGLSATGNLADLAQHTPFLPTDRGDSVHEVRMEQICQAAHGLSILITGTKDGISNTLLFDAGPEEEVFERNATRLGAELGKVKLVHLSHWHRDHSGKLHELHRHHLISANKEEKGGLLRAIRLINSAKPSSAPKVTVDLHPNRPDYRGVTLPDMQMSLEADPTFSEIADAGGLLSKKTAVHTVLDDFFLISGEIPRVTPYELGLRRGARFSKDKGLWEPDEKIEDEPFVMCKVKDKGIVMFTGCSHAGVVNASRHAVELGMGTPLYCVVGGYHLADAEASQIEASVLDLKALDPKILLPGHCTGWRAKHKIDEVMPGRFAPCVVGTRYTF